MAWSMITASCILAGTAVLVQRGSCPFSIKAENVQQAHAAALLIATSDDGELKTYITLKHVASSGRPRAIAIDFLQIVCTWFCRLYVHGSEYDRG